MFKAFYYKGKNGNISRSCRIKNIHEFYLFATTFNTVGYNIHALIVIVSLNCQHDNIVPTLTLC